MSMRFPLHVRPPHQQSQRASHSRVLAVISATLLLLLAACSRSTDAAPTPSGGPETLRIALYPGSLISLPVYLGVSNGIFAKHGLDIQIVEVSDGRNATAALLSGSVDLELNGLDNNAIAREQGQKIVAVAGNTNRSIFSLIVRKDYPTPNQAKGFPESVKDLKGAKVGVMATGGSVEIIARYVLSQAGLDPNKDVTIVNAGLPGTGVPALKAGQIDAYMSIEPAQSLAVQVGGFAKVAVDLRQSSLPQELSLTRWPYNQWASTAKVVADKRAAMTKFQASMKEVFAFMGDPANRSQVEKVALDKISKDPQLVASMVENNTQVFGFALPRDDVARASEYLMKVGLIKTPIVYEDYVADGAR